jgi:chromosome segregation ATPase
LEKIKSGKESDFRFIQLEINALENNLSNETNDLIQNLTKSIESLENELDDAISAISNAQSHLVHIADIVNDT